MGAGAAVSSGLAAAAQHLALARRFGGIAMDVQRLVRVDGHPQQLPTGREVLP